MSRIERMRAEVESFASGLHPTTAIVDRGTLDHPVFGPVPAVRTLNRIYRQTWMWAFTSTRRREKDPSGVEAHIPNAAYVPES